MGLKDTTSDWVNKENLESLCLHLLSVHLLRLSFSVSQSSWLLPSTLQDYIQHCAIAQREKDTDLLFLTSPDVSYSLYFSLTSLFQNSQGNNCSVCVRYLHQHQPTVEIKLCHKVGKWQYLQSNRMGEGTFQKMGPSPHDCHQKGTGRQLNRINHESWMCSRNC